MTEPRKHEPLPLGGEHGLPYSKGRMAHALMAVGVAPLRAYELAVRIEHDLAVRGAEVADLDRVDELAAEILGQEEGSGALRQLRRFRELRDLDLPIVVLIGGATGTGKSTVATELAYRLGITRVTSTDFIRQTLRAFFASDFMPTVHRSSFEAGDLLPNEEQETGDPTILGFLEQTRNVLVGARAAVERALDEGWSMVLEGVHLVPGMLPHRLPGALVVPCVLEISDEQLHAAHFYVRDATSHERRPMAKYHNRLAEIRRIQRYIVARAKKTGVPVIENADVDQTVAVVMELVVSAAERLREPVS